MRNKRRWVGLFTASCLSASAGCAPANPSDREDLSTAAAALAFGIQGFAKFDPTGATVAGTVATTIGTTVSAVRTGLGRYTVTFPFLAATSPSAAGQGGTFQVVAVGAGNERCTLATNWTYTVDHSVVGSVYCRAPGGIAKDSGFYAYYGRGPASSGKGAYVRVEADATVASPTSWAWNGAAINVSHPAVGTYWVFISTETREEVQVTAVSSSAYCHAALRELGVTTVRCFDELGTPVDAAFTLNQAARNSLPLAGMGAFAQVTASGAIDSRYDFNACPLGTSASSRVGIGRYTVSHTLVGEPLASYQLSAYDNGAGYCKVEGVTPSGRTATVTAACYSATGAPADLGFVESYAVYVDDCGGCPTSCQGGSCVLGVCQPVTLASGVAPRSVSADATTVYFTNDPGMVTSAPLVASVPRGGGTPTTLVTLASAGRPALADSMLAGPSYIYWFEATNTGAGVYRRPLGGGSRTLFAAGGLDPQARALSLVGTDLYFADSFASQLYRISPAGARTPLLPSPPPAGSPNYYPFNIATDALRVYFIRDTGNKVLSVPLAGGSPTELSAPSLSTPAPGLATSAIATDGLNVYFATSKASGNIFKVPVTGGTTSVFASVGGLVTGLAVNGGTVFWTVKTTGAVMSAPVTGTPIRTLASGENAPSSLFVDNSSIFWTNADAVRKLAR